MVKKILAMTMAIVMLCMQFAIAEDTLVCACCGCVVSQVQQDKGEAAELTAEEAYREWFLLAFPLLSSCYTNSTWIDKIQGWKNDTLESLDVSFLLREDILTITDAELAELRLVNNAEKLNYLDSIPPMYDFIHQTVECIEFVRVAKSEMVREVPAQYAYVDSQIESLMTTLLNLRTQLVLHITTNQTMSGFVFQSTAITSLKSIYNGLERIYTLVK